MKHDRQHRRFIARLSDVRNVLLSQALQGISLKHINGFNPFALLRYETNPKSTFQ